VTTVCDDVRARRLLGRAEAGDATHVAACADCAAAVAALGRVHAAFAADVAPEPTPALAARVRSAVRPLLAARRRHAERRALAAAVLVALLPLPLIVLVDVWVLQALYGGLSRFLSPTVSFYLVVNYAAVLALLGTLTYGAIPFLAERQARGRYEARHG
jgi:hypothetical protein